MMTRLAWQLGMASGWMCVLVPLLMVLRHVTRGRVDERVRYAAWLLPVLRLVIPFDLQVALPLPRTLLPAADLRAEMAQAVGVAGAAEATAQAGQAAGPDWLLLALCVWAAGALLTAGWMLWRNLRFRRALGALPMHGEVWRRYAGRMAGMGVTLPPVRITPAVDAPCLFGAVRPVILLPEDAVWRDWLPYALVHEACHAKAQDTRWALLRAAVCCVLWFHPLVWLAARLSRADAELACDARVLRVIAPEERLPYATALLDIASQRCARMPVVATGVAFAGARLRDRIGGIVGGNRMRKGLTLLLAVVMLLALGMSFVTAEAAAGGVIAADATVHVLQGNRYEAVRTARREAAQVEYVWGNWCWARYGDTEGYVHLSDIQLDAKAFAGARAWVSLPASSIETASSLNVRDAPAVESKIEVRLFDGVPLKVDSFGTDWCAVSTLGYGDAVQRGFAMTMFLSIGADPLAEGLIAPPQWDYTPVLAAQGA